MSRRLALLISNNQYSDVNLRKLAAPVADAAALATVLRDPAIGAFDDVQTLINEPASEVRHAIAAFFHGKQPTDLLLLYFSGHGLLDERSRLYLATADTDAKLPRARAVEASYIAQEMDDSRSKRQVLLLDCCHSGAFRQGITKSAIGQPVQTGGIFDGDGRVVLAASDATQYAFEGETLVGDGVRSVFTHYLVEGLTGLRADVNHDGQVTVDELYDYLYPRVTAHTPTQTPVKWSYKQRGIFVLAGQGNPAPVAALPPPPAAGAAKAPTWRTWVVDQMYRGDFTTIGEAIAAAQAGDKIIIRRGVYNEGLVIDKPLEIEGEDELGHVIIQVTDKNVIRFNALIGKVCNVTLRQLGGKGRDVVIIQGQLLLEGCDISSQRGSCVSIHDYAYPILRNNRIHDGIAGIIVYKQGQGVIEGNEIFNNLVANISIEGGGNPIVRNNRIHDSRVNGVSVLEQGQGLIEGNEIFNNGQAGIRIRSGSNPTVRNNRIHDSQSAGIMVYEQGQGLIEGNEIFANDSAGIEISGSNPTVRNNRINKNSYWAIWIHKGGRGRFEENDLRDNKRGAWKIDDDCLPNVTRVGNVE